MLLSVIKSTLIIHMLHSTTINTCPGSDSTTILFLQYNLSSSESNTATIIYISHLQFLGNLVSVYKSQSLLKCLTSLLHKVSPWMFIWTIQNQFFHQFHVCFVNSLWECQYFCYIDWNTNLKRNYKYINQRSRLAQ